MKNSYLLYNGDIIPRSTLRLSTEEWLLKAGLTLRIDLFASGNRIPFLEAHLRLLEKQFAAAGWIMPVVFDIHNLKIKFEKLLNKNRLFKGSRIHWYIIPGLPAGTFDGLTEFMYLAFTEELEFDYFPINQKGLALGISANYRNTGEPFYSSVARSRIRHLLIKQEAMSNGWNDILLLDQEGNLSEASDGNLFIRMKNEILTPSPFNNCLPRAMYMIIRSLCFDEGISVTESPVIKPDDLLHADEIFLTDDTDGIRWVLSYEKKRFYRKTAVLLNEMLKKRLDGMDQFHIGFSG